MTRSELMQKLRIDFANHIRNTYIEDECENCGSKDNLHVHHKIMFSTQFSTVLDLLKIEDKEEYSDEEVTLIRYMMLGVQCKNNDYITLCDECHRKHHLTEITKTGLTREETYNKYLDGSLKLEIHESNLRKWYTKDELIALCNEFNIKNNRGKPIGYLTFEKILNVNHYIVQKNKKQIKGIRQTYYMIERKKGRKCKVNK